MRVELATAAALVGALSAVSAAARATVDVQSTTALLTPLDAELTFDGFGGLSAGASSRLLWDYPEPQRSQILDFLYLPNYGAGLTINKVEIGGSTASTDGAEPSISLSGEDLVCSRGYENWLIAESKARNPGVKVFGLSWGVPAWVQNGTGQYFTQANIDYHVAWVQCVFEQTGAVVDYIGVWNERTIAVSDLDWVVQFRYALDAAGFSNTRIIIPDGHDTPWDLVDALAANETQLNAVDGIGLHYPCNEPMVGVQALGLKFWSSEDYSSSAGAWASGGDVWGRLLVQNFLRMNATATIAWSTIWSVYGNLVCQQDGLMRAMEPWSGYYSVDTAIWTSAHLGQFVQPGWTFLNVGAGTGSGYLSGGGGFVTLVDDADFPTQFVTIVETLQAPGYCGPTTQASGAQNLTLVLAPEMPRAPPTGMALWRTTNSSSFLKIATGLQPSYNASGFGFLTLTILPDAIYTLTSHPGSQQAGEPATPIPASAPFPLPWNTSFETPGAPGTYNTLLPLYFSDMTGTWEVHAGAVPPAPAPGAGSASLVQELLVNPGATSWVGNADPIVMAGDIAWSDVELAVWGFLPSAPTVGVSDEQSTVFLSSCTSNNGYETWENNTAEANFLSNNGSGLCLNQNGCNSVPGSSVIAYTCITDAETCGTGQGQENLQWVLDGSSRLVLLLNGLCVQADNSSLLYMTTCSSSPAQQFTYDSSNRLVHRATGLCVSVPQPARYLQLCRVNSLNGFSQTMAAYCLQVNETSYQVLSFSASGGSTTLSSGSIPSGAWQPSGSSGSWIELSLAFSGSTIQPSLGSTALPSVQSSTYTSGNAALGCGWHSCAFDLFSASAFGATPRLANPTLHVQQLHRSQLRPPQQ
jgi:Glycosyl hydrolase family 59/Ricin-type beta-trefoil lectin domain